MAGGAIRVRSVIRNAGTFRASRSTLLVALSRDRSFDRLDTRLRVHRMSLVGVGRSRRIVLGGRIPNSMPAGRVRLLVCADAGRTIRELDERNNCVAGPWLTIRRPTPAIVEPPPPVAPVEPPVQTTPVTPVTRMIPAGSKADVAVRTRDGEIITYDVSWPRHAEPLPLVVLIHGGGWWLGDKRDAYLLDAAARLNAAGFVAASINYRLACGTSDEPRWVEGFDFTLRSRMCGARLPTMVGDVTDAVRQLQATADTIGADRSRIALVGASAGGHLAYLAAAELGSPSIRAIASWSGPPTTAFIAAQVNEPRLRPSFTNAIGCDSVSCPDRWDAASPLAAIERQRPAYAVFSLGGELEQQVPFNELTAFHTRLDELAIPNVLFAGLGTCHGSQCLGAGVVGRRVTGLEATIQFLNEHLSFV